MTARQPGRDSSRYVKVRQTAEITAPSSVRDMLSQKLLRCAASATHVDENDEAGNR